MTRRASSTDRAQSDAVASEVVVVLDDDPSVRDALENLLGSVGLAVVAFATASECLAYLDRQNASCLVLDIRLPGKNGLDFHDELKRANIPVPVVFISGYADVRMSVRAMKAGAVEFLSKPFRDQELLDAIQRGIEQNRDRLEREDTLAALQARWATLTAREREVMAGVTIGLRNKAIAMALGISEVTVKTHRGQVMRKMGAATLPDLVRMSDALATELSRIIA
jgi:FixJ family two-component response regulator